MGWEEDGKIAQAEDGAANGDTNGSTVYDPTKFDEDGKPRRKGNVMTASAHVITAVIGSGVLSLAWSIAQMGWIAGPSVLLLFAGVTYYTSCLLADCYRYPDPVTGKRNYTYMETVQANLGPKQVWACGLVQYSNLLGTSIGYTITGAQSAR
jgi:amino acid permease